LDLGKIELTYRQLTSQKGLLELIFKVTILPLSFINYVYSTLRRLIYQTDIMRKYKFNKPIISVGNINIGGSGKTPLIIYIAKRMIKSGYRPAIVMSKEASRDESLVYKAQLPDIPVFTEHSKIDSIRRANTGNSDVILIDDGFQLLNIRKDLDIVIVRDDVSSAPFPLGWGRENLMSLRFADCIIISKRYKLLSTKYIKNIRKPIFTMRQVPLEIINALNNKSLDMNKLYGEKVLIFSMVPSIEYIAFELSKFGLKVKIMQFPDHYRYKKSDLDNILLRMGSVKYIITTEKDIANIKRDFPKICGSLWVLKSELDIDNEKYFFQSVLKAVKSK